MNNKELKNIYGGVSFSGTLLNAIAKLATTVYDIGKRLGSTIIRVKTGNTCSL